MCSNVLPLQRWMSLRYIVLHQNFILFFLLLLLRKLMELKSNLSSQIHKLPRIQFKTHELEICLPVFLLLGFAEWWKHSKVANTSYLGLTSRTEINRGNILFSNWDAEFCWFEFWWHRLPKHKSENDSYPWSHRLPHPTSIIHSWGKIMVISNCTHSYLITAVIGHLCTHNQKQMPDFHCQQQV